MLKVMWLLKKFIVSYMFLHFLFVAVLTHFTSKNFLQNPLANIISFNGIFCVVLAYFVYTYIKRSLVFNIKETEVNFLDDIACIWGAILLFLTMLFITVYGMVTGERIHFLGIIFLFIFAAAPAFWLKFIINLNIWFFCKILSIFITINTGRYLLKKDKEGNLSTLEAFNAFMFMFATSEILDKKLDFEIDENSNLLNMEEIKDTNIITILNKKWNTRKNIIIAIIILVFGLGNLIHTCLTF